MAQRPEIRALTGVRALAAIWVVLYHLDGKAFRVSTAGPVGVFIDAWVRSGSIGVELFFVLSGLILSYNYAERMAKPSVRGYREFLVMRLARIYPVHLFTLLLLVPLYLVASRAGIPVGDPRQYGADEFAKNLLLVHNWFPPAAESWNVQSWSISAEWLAYLAFPLMLPLLARVEG